MRAAPQRYPASGFAGATLVGLPAGAPGSGTALAPAAAAAAGPDLGPARRGRPGRDPRLRVRARLPCSPARLTDGQPTVYDAVDAVENHLRENYDYSPNVDPHTYPISRRSCSRTRPATASTSPARWP